MGITDTHCEEAAAFRRRIKHVRDRVFREELSEPLQEVAAVELAVPKLLWKDAAFDTDADRDDDTATAGTADDEEGAAQTGLEMF
jgi:hypothetical protein